MKHHKTSLKPPLFMELLVPRYDSERSCICVLEVSILPLSTILIFDFGNVPTVWYFCISFYCMFRQCRYIVCQCSHEINPNVNRNYSPTGNKYMSCILEYFGQQHTDNWKKTIPLGSLVWCWSVWAVFSLGIISS